MKIKILMIDAGGWGGITHYTYNLMQALAARGEIECALLTDRAYELDGLPRNFGVIKRPLNGRAYLPALLRVLRVVSEYKPHVVHVQTMLTARRDWLVFLIARICGVKVVFTAHNVLPHEDREKNALCMRSVFKIIYASSQRIIVHSRFSLDKLTALFRIGRDKVRVIPHGNYLFFRTEQMSKDRARRGLGLGIGRKIVLQFGALREYKGLDILLEAFAKVRERDPAALLLIVGKPINLDPGSIIEKARAMGMENDVVLKAEYIPVEQMAMYFFAADVVVFPYKEIDMSGSLQLAYAFAKPVVCASSGGLPEVVKEGKNGLLVRPNDSSGLAEGLSRLLADEDLIRKMGEESLRLAKEEFSWERIAASTIGVYQDIAGG
ncbi:MAG: glycosyltransferase family 4 protein [Candidatus Omnitrophota bacterium]